MKKNIFLVFVLSFLILIPFIVSADMVVPFHKPGCTVITNLDTYPDIYVIGNIFPIMGTKDYSYIVKNNVCLNKDYKFNLFKLLISKKSYIDNVGIDKVNPFGELDKSSFESIINAKLSDNNFSILSSSIEPYSEGKNEYRITMSPEGNYYLEKTTLTKLSQFYYEYRYNIITFLLTIFFEFVILLLFLKKTASIKSIFFYNFLINIITQPLANYIISNEKLYDRFIGNYLSRLIFILIVEVLVLIVEGFLIKYFFKITYKKAFLISFVANIFTGLLSLILLALNL